MINLLVQLEMSDSKNVVIAYNDKIVDMGYATPNIEKLTKKEKDLQFNRGAMRIQDNLCSGGYTETTGYLKTPEGKYYVIEKGKKKARLLK